MNIFRFGKTVSSAPVARERLQILLEYERSSVTLKDLIVVLRAEILAVVARHISIDPDKAHVRIDRGAEFAKLEVDIEIPTVAGGRLAAVGA